MFDVYNLLDIEPVKAEKAYFWDRDGNKYLDFYGGHAVISIGHSHPHYVELVTGQLNRIGFYSNAVKNHLQEELEWKLRELSGCTDYNLFLCNSGAELTRSFETVFFCYGAFENTGHARCLSRAYELGPLPSRITRQYRHLGAGDIK